MPDVSTAAAALQMGEIDWWEQPAPDYWPLLRRNNNLKVENIDPYGSAGVIRFNFQQSPSSNPALRRAALAAISQADVMTAIVGDDAASRKDRVGFFLPGTLMASDAGMNTLKEPPDRAAARRMLQASGYQGETLVFIVPSDKVPGGVLALMRGLPAEHAPGSRFNYNTGDTYLLGCLVSAATGTTLADYMSRKIWVRLGMEFDAFYTLEAEGGQEIGGSRAGMAMRDFGRFGVFVLNDGALGDTRLLPEGWVDEAGRSAFALDPKENSYGATAYGYSWWLDEQGAMVAVGFAGQTLYINRREGVVIVTLSCQPQPPYAVADGFDFKAERKAFHAAVVSHLSTEKEADEYGSAIAALVILDTHPELESSHTGLPQPFLTVS